MAEACLLFAQNLLLPLKTDKCSEIVPVGTILTKTSKQGYALIQDIPAHKGTS